MHESPTRIRVESYAGYRGEERPRRLLLDDRTVEVAEILDAWRAPEHRYFRILGADGATYLIRRVTVTGLWELESYEPG